MSTDTVTATEPVVHDEANSTPAPAPVAPVVPVEQVESSNSNGVHANGTNNNSDAAFTEPSHEGQDEPNKHDYQDDNQSALNKNELEPESLRKVFIGGLSYKTDDQAFRDYFSKFGDIVVSEMRND